MSATQITLLSNIEHGVPAGNYDGSSTAFSSDPAPAAGYYQGQGSVQTVLINITSFSGAVVTQATLNHESESAAWFDVDTYAPADDTTEIHSVDIIGNFVWIRTCVQDFESGTINSVTLSY